MRSNYLIVVHCSATQGNRTLFLEASDDGTIELEEWLKSCPFYDAIEDFMESSADETEETQSIQNYFKNRKGGKLWE